MHYILTHYEIRRISLLPSFCSKINTNQNFCAIIWNKICYIIFVKFSLGVATCNASHEARFARAMGKAFVILSASEVSINAKLKMTNLVVLLNSLAKARQTHETIWHKGFAKHCKYYCKSI